MRHDTRTERRQKDVGRTRNKREKEVLLSFDREITRNDTKYVTIRQRLRRYFAVKGQHKKDIVHGLLMSHLPISHNYTEIS